MICFIHYDLLPLQVLEQFPEFCGKLKQICIPDPYWWKTSNILCHIILRAKSSDSVSFSVSVFFENWTVTLSYSTNSMRRLGIPLYIPNSLHTPVFILIQLS